MINREQAIIIAVKFSKWLADISEQENVDKDEMQAIIKQFLIG